MSEHNSDPARKRQPEIPADAGPKKRRDGSLRDGTPSEAFFRMLDSHAGEKLTPLNEAAWRNLAKHVCKHYTIRDGRTVCVYCGNEMEL